MQERAPLRFRAVWLLWLVPLVFYAASMAHSIGLPDAAIIIDAMRKPVLSSSAVNHNLNNLIGFVFNLLPGGNAVLKSNLVSVVYGGVAIGLFYVLLRNLAVRGMVAVLCAGILMVSHSMWWHSTQVENYGLSVVFLLACMLLVVRAEKQDARPQRAYAIPALFFLAGLSLFNHLQNGVLTLAACAYLAVTCTRRSADAGLPAVKPACRGRLLFRVLLAYAAGVLPWACVFVADCVRSGDAMATIGALAGGGFRRFMFLYDIPRGLRDLGDWVFMQFPSPFLAFIPVGMAVLWRRRGLAVFVFTVFLVNTLFFMGYRTWDQFSFYLLSFVCLALMGALGVEWCMQRVPAWGRFGIATALVVSLLLPPCVYPQIATWAAEPDGYWGRRYHATLKAYEGRFDLVSLYTDPMRHDRGTVAEWIGLLFERLPPGALLVDDVSGYYQIEYLRVCRGARPDLRVVLLRPFGMAGWGMDVTEATSLATATTGRVFVVSTNGPCAEVVSALGQHGRRPELYRLTTNRGVYELVDGATQRKP